ncbi:hypothetical protein D3C81_1044050 [compost metagenome]
MQYQGAAAGHREEVGAADAQVDDGIELGIDASHRHVALSRLTGQLGEALILEGLHRIGLEHPHPGEGLLGLVVEPGEGPLRRLELLVDLGTKAVHEEGHHRQRQQGEQGQLPGVLAAHDGEHQDPDDEGVHQGQYPLSGRHLHRLDVVGGMGHQIAGAVALIEIRAHAGEVGKEAVAQHIGEPVGGPEQHDPPHITQQIDEQAEAKEPRQIAHQGTVIELPPGDTIHYPAHHLGGDHGQQGHHHQQGDGHQITPPLILEKPAKPQKYAHSKVLARGTAGAAWS